MDPVGLILAAAGVFAICGAVFDWSFFIDNYRAKFLLFALGRKGTRIFYVCLGLFVLIGGVLMALGLLPEAG